MRPAAGQVQVAAPGFQRDQIIAGLLAKGIGAAVQAGRIVGDIGTVRPLLQSVQEVPGQHVGLAQGQAQLPQFLLPC